MKKCPFCEKGIHDDSAACPLRARQGIGESFLGVEAPGWQGARSEHSGPM